MGSKGRWKNACAFEVSGHGRPYLFALMCIVVAQSMSEVERERERFTCSVRLSEVAEAPIDVLGMNTTETTCTLSFEGEIKNTCPWPDRDLPLDVTLPSRGQPSYFGHSSPNG